MRPRSIGCSGKGVKEGDVKITVKLGEPLWRRVGKRTLQLEWTQSSITIAEVLRHLERMYSGFGSAFRGEGLKATYPYNLFVNARLIRLEEAERTLLRDGDKLYIFIPVVGG